MRVVDDGGRRLAATETRRAGTLAIPLRPELTATVGQRRESIGRAAARSTPVRGYSLRRSVSECFREGGSSVRSSLVCSSVGSYGRLVVATASIVLCLGATVLVSPAAAEQSPTTRACPSARVVDDALAQTGLKAPVATLYPEAKTCTYQGYSGILKTMSIMFQMDTSKTFAISEKAVPASLRATVPHLGEAAWESSAGGSLYVFDGQETVKILAIGTPLSKLEVLARELI
jgi:hypothetical protein